MNFLDFFLKNPKTTIIGLLIMLGQFLLQGQYISQELYNASLSLLAALGFLVANDAPIKGREDGKKPPARTEIWLIVFFLSAFSLQSCTILRQLDDDDVLRNFTENTISSIFNVDKVSLKSDSINLQAKVSYQKLKEYIKERHLQKFTKKGIVQADNLLIYTSLDWLYFDDQTVLLNYKRIKKPQNPIPQPQN
jgi:hypothetical protein